MLCLYFVKARFYLLQDTDMFYKAKSIGSKGTKIKVFCEGNAYLDSILAKIVTPGPDI